MALYRCPSILIAALTIAIIAVQIDQSSAKQSSSTNFRYIPYKKTPRIIRTGGCSAFGHSCFGGHGKRADEGVVLLPGSDSDLQSRLVFPPAATASEGRDEDAVQAGHYGALSPSPSETFVPSSHNLSPFLRQWLQSYQRSAGDIEAK